ncbi:MAG TPA: nuclear transport factor 2 family protein [Stellaceae bacterium]|nr:nuclear transport factor 2 family protein [Stellaceae bacterium]
MPELTDEEYRQFRELVDKEAIREVNARNSRAVDRMDEALLRSVYWPDAWDSASFFDGSVQDHVPWVMGFLKQLVSTSHSVCHQHIELEGDHAWSESYFICYACGPDETGEMREIINAGRYLDHYEKRDGEWRFKHRSRAYDWNMNHPYSSTWEKSPLVEIMARGERGHGDPVYHMRETLR